MAWAWHRGEDLCQGLYLPAWRRSALDAVVASDPAWRGLLTALAGRLGHVPLGTALASHMADELMPLAGPWWRELAEWAVPSQPLPERDVLLACLVASDRARSEDVGWRVLYEYLGDAIENGLTLESVDPG